MDCKTIQDKEIISNLLCTILNNNNSPIYLLALTQHGLLPICLKWLENRHRRVMNEVFSLLEVGYMIYRIQYWKEVKRLINIDQNLVNHTHNSFLPPSGHMESVGVALVVEGSAPSFIFVTKSSSM